MGKVPLLDLTRAWRDIEDEVNRAVADVLRTQLMILGEGVRAFEGTLAERLDVRYAVGCASGTDALLLALMALEIGPGDEVVTTPFTFFATASSIARVLARPVFVDIDPHTFNIDVDRIAAAVTSKTKAILPVHLYGQSAEMASILALAESRGLAVVEDAAQAIGATYHGRPCGGMGTIGCLSFYPTKNLGAAGDAGALTTNDADLADTLRRLRVHGAADAPYVHDRVGINSRLDELQAVILNVKMKRLDAWNAERRRLASRYDAALADLDAVTPPGVAAGCIHVYHQYVIRAAQRDALRAHLDAAGVSTRVFYPVPMHQQPCFTTLGHAKGDFPEAERACDEVLSLPVFPGLTEDEQDVVAGAVRAFYAKGRSQVSMVDAPSKENR